MKRLLISAALLLASIAANAALSDSAVYTLYRNSVTDAAMRLHVATFDAAEGVEYNRENCTQAQLLFQAQPGVRARFWCEKGAYRK